MRVGIIVGFLAALAGCGARTIENTPAEDVAWAEQRVEGQRAIKRQLVRADPIERKIEAHLLQDPRVASARFAITVASYGTCGPSDFEPMTFATVITTREAMTEPQMRQLLRDACAAAGVTMNTPLTPVARDGNTWGMSYGTLNRHGDENPDLSGIRVD